MSEKKDSNVVGAVNVQRRTWDKADYEEKAKARAATEAEGVVVNDGKWKTEFPDAPDGMERVPGSKRAYLTSEKQESVDLEKNLHQRVVMQATEGAPSTSAFVSKKTGVVVQNSLAYLDHIHGKKYQRAMGMSMRVKAAELSDVQARLAQLKAKKAPPKRSKGGGAAEPMRHDLKGKLEAFNARVSQQIAAKKRAREPEGDAASAPVPAAAGDSASSSDASAPSSSKAPRTDASVGDTPAPAATAEPDAELAAMQAMMGFGGFASGGKS